MECQKKVRTALGGGGHERRAALRQGSAVHRERDGFYLATVNHEGWPYMQFRGGPKGFLKVIDERTLAYLDFSGNRQYISMGNLRANNRASLFFMDYANRRRLKLLATTEVLSLTERADLLEALDDPEYPGKPERAVLFKVVAFDWNCPQHITPRFTLEELEQMSWGPVPMDGGNRAEAPQAIAGCFGLAGPLILGVDNQRAVDSSSEFTGPSGKYAHRLAPSSPGSCFPYVEQTPQRLPRRLPGAALGRLVALWNVVHQSHGHHGLAVPDDLPER